MRNIESTITLATQGPMPTGRHRLAVTVGVMLLALSACAKDRTSSDTSATANVRTAPMDTGSLTGMRGMPMQDSGAVSGMSGMKNTMGDMQKQMDGIMKATPTQMKAMMPAHRQMAANMLGEMTAEMRKMNMSGDAAWTAAVDSVRQDLLHMPELNGRELEAAMPAHHSRMMRLMTMHQAMTKNMKM